MALDGTLKMGTLGHFKAAVASWLTCATNALACLATVGALRDRPAFLGHEV